MVKAKTTNGDIILGLSEENLKRLKEGKPIKINLKDMGLENRTVIIMYGKTEQSIYEELRKL